MAKDLPKRWHDLLVKEGLKDSQDRSFSLGDRVDLAEMTLRLVQRVEALEVDVGKLKEKL